MASSFVSTAIRVCSIMLVSASGSVAGAQVPVPSQASMDANVIAQVLADLSLSGTPARLLQRIGSGEAGIETRTRAAPCDGVLLFSVQLAQSIDGTPRLVARADSQTFLLGGFSAPEAIALSASVDQASRSECLTASALARLLDPNGWIDVADGSSTAASIVRWQQRRVLGGWPSDTVTHLSGGLRVERLTVFSRTAGPAPQWIPVRYTFVFNPRDELIGWSREQGAAIGP